MQVSLSRDPQRASTSPLALVFVVENTGFNVDNIYANPSRSVYYALGMDIGNLLSTPAGVEKRSYVPKSDMQNAASSVFVSLSSVSELLTLHFSYIESICQFHRKPSCNRQTLESTAIYPN